MKKITELWAFVANDEAEGVEGLIGMATSVGWMPFVAADVDRVVALRPTAQHIATEMGVEVSLKRFSQSTLVEVLRP